MVLKTRNTPAHKKRKEVNPDVYPVRHYRINPDVYPPRDKSDKKTK